MSLNLDQDNLRGNPRATLASWLRYESIVISAYRQHPTPFRYQPTNMAASTVCSRIRDAIRGKLAFNYPCVIDSEALRTWYASVIVRYSENQVYIGVPGQYLAPLTGIITGKPTESTHLYSSLSLEEVIAFTILISSGRILGPVVIQHPPDISLVPDRPNVDLIPRPDGGLAIV